MEALHIYLFGGFLLERGGVTLAPIASRVGRSLFAYLVLNRDRHIQRDLVAGSFWPELPESKARRRLSQTLWQMQDVLNEGERSHLVATSDTVYFDTSRPYWLDVEEFDRSFELSASSSAETIRGRRIDTAGLRRCVELYRGDLLAGYFDDWVIVDQDHYRQRYVTALRRLVDATKSDGAYEEALVHARRLTHHEPLDEEVHREVMRLCFLLGRTSEAVEQFERYRSVLSEELDAEPSGPMLELFERIVRHKAARIRPASSQTAGFAQGNRPSYPFVGREDERRRMVDSMERVLAGSGGVVLVEGEPGVGKTRLATEAAEDAQWRGFEVSWGTCKPGTVRAFAPIAQILESLAPLRIEKLKQQLEPVWLNESMRIAPKFRANGHSSVSSAPLPASEESTRMREALISTLVALGRITPHLLVIDDVQWADRDTLSVLTQLGERLAGSRLLLLLVYRSEEARGDAETWDALRGLDRDAGIQRVVLSPLSVFELDEMVKRIVGIASLDPKVSTDLHRRTGGNALFALETLLAMRDQGLFDGADPAEALSQQVERHTLPVAPRVRAIIDARVSLLDRDATGVYESAAVCGEPVGLDVLTAAADLGRPAAADAVENLVYRGLLKETGDDRYTITHDQVRQVVYDGIDPDHRAVLHRRVAEAMEVTAPADVEAIGFHFTEGRDPVRAVSYLQRAGVKAADLNAYATAAQHLQSARALAVAAHWSPRDRYELLGDLETVLGVLGHRDGQRDVLKEMSQLVESVEGARGDHLRRSALVLGHLADFAMAEEAARASLDAERAGGSRSGLASSLMTLGTVLRWSGRPKDAVEPLEEAVSVSVEDARIRADAMVELASTLVEVQRFARGRELIDRSAQTLASIGNRRGQAEVAGIMGRALLQEGEPEEARPQFERAIELCREIGFRHGEGVNLVNLAVLDHTRGQVADALTSYEAARRVFSDLGNTRGEAMVLANSASARHALLGDDERAEADARRGLDLFTEMGDTARQAQCLDIMAGVAARRGDLDEGRRLSEESLARLDRAGNRFLEAQHLRSLGLIQIGLREHDEALSTLDRALAVCSESGLVDLAVELASVKGMALLGAGEVAAALEITTKAVAGMRPGVERPHLVHHRHSLVAEANNRLGESRAAALRANELLDESLAGLPTSERERSVSRIPEHAEIAARAAVHMPRVAEVLLAKETAPSGRALTEDDMRVVTWTVDDPSDVEVGSDIERRRTRLLRLMGEALDSGTVPSMQQLAEALDVSESTVRRDLAHLRDEGHEVRTRGTGIRAS